MRKKDKTDILDEYMKLKDEIIFDKVNDIFRSQPKNFIPALSEMGFEYYEDEVDEEEIKERVAKPENQNQKDLVAFFEGKKDVSESIMAIFLSERNSVHPNFPLFRKYFKKANQNLKALLLYCLDRYPTRTDLLADLAYFHEFQNILTLLIEYYILACEKETDMEKFTEIAQDFYYSSSPDGYESLIALQDIFEPGTDKRKIVDYLITEEDEADDSMIPI
jgi:hypothetical protein